MKVFRKYRIASINKERIYKYLLYALGEIVLVVIGILIALQLNNLNDQSKLSKLEKDTLTRLNNDLQLNLNEVTGIRNDVASKIKSANTILEILELETPDSIHTDSLFEDVSGGNIFNNANTTYKSISGNLSNSITNDELRLRITEVYERDFYNIHRRESYEIQILDDYYIPLTLKLFKHSSSKNISLFGNTTRSVNRPLNLQQINNNQEFINTIIALTNQRETRYYYLNETIITLESLIDDIQSEIQEINN